MKQGGTRLCFRKQLDNYKNGITKVDLTLDKRIINEMMHSPYIDGAH